MPKHAGIAPPLHAGMRPPARAGMPTPAAHATRCLLDWCERSLCTLGELGCRKRGVARNERQHPRAHVAALLWLAGKALQLELVCGVKRLARYDLWRHRKR
eukprot:355571-Chlamydomonas_euryale.AAC.7